MGVAWKVTPEVSRFDEALDYFGKRVVMTAADARKLDDAHKVDAFWVGGGLQLAQVQRVFDKINRAVENGESFDEWRKGVLGELRNDAHAETVFRNATQRAYLAGRWAQMREPNTLRFRPYWLVDAILDSRTTEYCKLCNGTLQPADSEYWLTHYFPAHHRCRTCVRCLTAREAERRGGLKAPPEGLEPDPGFGQAPPVAEQWKPDPDKHDGKLIKLLETKAATGTKKRKPAKPPAPKPKLDLDTWVEHYTPKYGADVAQSLGRGRAALELGLDLPAGEIIKHLQTVDAPGVTAMLKSLKGVDRKRTLREQAGELEPLRKAAAALGGHLQALAKRAAPITHSKLAAMTHGEKALAFFTKIMADFLDVPGEDWRFGYLANTNAFCSAEKKIIVYSARRGTLEHEYAHAIEALNPQTERRAIAYLNARRKGFALVEHGQNGKCWDDNFGHWYVGRRYTIDPDPDPKKVDEDAPLRATELQSTATELLFAGTTFWGSLEDLVRQDSEHFLFVLGQFSTP